MDKKGFTFSQNLMDELGSHHQDSNTYSSGESWTDSQFLGSQDVGYQTSDSLPESFLPSRPRPTIPRPPSFPSIAVSQNQRWKFRPAMGASGKKNDAIERDLRSHLDKVARSINMIPSNVSKLLEEAVTYIESSVNQVGNSGLDTVSAIDEIKHSLERLKIDQVEVFQLQKEAKEKCVKLDDICQANGDILAYLERQEINIANVKGIILNPEKEMGILEINKRISSLDCLIRNVTASESNIVQKVVNMNSELQSSLEVYDANLKNQFDSLSRKLTEYTEELQETKDLVSQLPSQIKTIFGEELANIQKSVAKRPRPLDLIVNDSTSSPKRKATPSTPYFNYSNSVPLPIPTIKINGKAKLIKEENSNIKNIMNNVFKLKKEEDLENIANDSIEPFPNLKYYDKESRLENGGPAQIMDENETVPFTQDLPIFGHVDSEDDSDNRSDDAIDSFSDDGIENEILNNAQFNITTFTLSDSF